MTPRGIRNNNPGNIRHGTDKWQGMAEVQDDNEFVTFTSPLFGIRAIARILLRYQERGITHIGAIIRTYAPPSENNTGAYIDTVCAGCGLKPVDIVDLDDVQIMLPLVKAIIRQENGQQPYSDQTIIDGLRMAGICNAQPKPLIQSRTISGSVVAGTATGLSAVAEASKQVDSWKDTLSGLVPYIDSLKYVLLALTILGIGLTIYARVSERREGRN